MVKRTAGCNRRGPRLLYSFVEALKLGPETLKVKSLFALNSFLETE
jgi:hypothetical protein